MRLKKELDSVLNLQAELDILNTAIDATKQTLKDGASPKDTLSLVNNLTATSDVLSSQVDRLYNSLNVPGRFPELQQCSLDFVRLLLITRDLKINIRKRAIGSFFEWDKLDQAVGGRQQSLG